MLLGALEVPEPEERCAEVVGGDEGPGILGAENASVALLRLAVERFGLVESALIGTERAHVVDGLEAFDVLLVERLSQAPCLGEIRLCSLKIASFDVEHAHVVDGLDRVRVFVAKKAAPGVERFNEKVLRAIGATPG